ncbi:MAG: aroA [Acidimicrobiales bacterium]|nr:aroA [Acidimicrobiales bacterium]
MTDPRPGLADLPDPLPIAPVTGPLDATVRVPGSKSITNRALVCAALATGPSTLEGALFADDTEAMVGVLRSVGIDVRTDAPGERIAVEGCGGALPPGAAALDVRQSGTTARFVAPLLALGSGPYRLTGDPQLLARPMGPSFDALRALGVPVEELADAGHLPATVRGGGLSGGVVRVPGDVSSQFLSGLLLIGPCLPDGLIVEVTTPLVSRPYVELTLAVMGAFGATTESPDPSTFAVAPGGYRGVVGYRIEPDASTASYPLAAAAICGGRVRVAGLGSGSLQGDAGFADLLAAMGATVHRDADGTEVSGPDRLRGGEFDLTHLSDTAQTLAACAAYADGPVRVRGIGFIRRKETDRVAAVATELRRCGVGVVEEDDGWLIEPAPVHGAVVQTYDDHRMAMSFALLGLRTAGIEIAGPGCVAKTFPGYWALLDELRGPAGR